MKNLEIFLEIKNQTSFKPDLGKIKNRLAIILKKYQISGNIEIGISLVGVKTIRLLNQKYRKIDQVTDVLSFPTSQKTNKKIVLPINNLGDIVVCPVQAKAQTHDKTVEKEILLLIDHGLLHLIGIHHKE